MKLLNIFTFFKIQKKIVLLFVTLFCVFFSFGVNSTSYVATANANTAQTATQTATAQTSPKEKDTHAWLARAINSIIKIAAVFLSLLTYLLSMFLSPEWITGSLFGIQEYLKSIWILVSNIVYIVFAFLLIGIAFMNIVGVGNDKFQLKQSLPKFIIGILIVPFSWFIVQFVLSITSVFSIIALTLPYDSFDNYKNHIQSLELPKKCKLNIGGKLEKVEKNAKGEKPKGELVTGDISGFIQCQEKSKINFAETTSTAESVYTLISLYTYAIMGIDSTDKFDKLTIKSAVEIADVFGKLAFDVVFVIVYFVLILALALVLMTRGIYLWIYMMMSPVFGLMYFFGKSSGGGGFFEKFNVKEFIALAMVPVYSMLALSFGMLFLFIVGKGMMTPSVWTEGVSTVQLKPAENAAEGAETISIGKDFELTIEGFGSTTISNVKEGADAAKTAAKLGGGLALGLIGTFILKVMGIVILWGAMMAALRSSTITKALVEPLYQFGSSVGQIATKAPTYAPILPKGQSFQSLQRIGSTYQGSLETKASRDAAGITNKWNPFDAGNLAGKLEELKGEIKKANDPQHKARLFKKFMALMKGDLNQLTSNSLARDTWTQIMQHNGMDTSKYDLKNLDSISKSINDYSDSKTAVGRELYADKQRITGGNVDDIGEGNKWSKYYENNDGDNKVSSYETHKYHGEELEVQRDKENNIIDIRVDYPDDIESLIRALSLTVDTTNKTIGKTKAEFKNKLGSKFDDVDVDSIANRIVANGYTFDATGSSSASSSGTGTPPPPSGGTPSSGGTSGSGTTS